MSNTRELTELLEMATFAREYVIVHTARTWERIRTEQPFQEMPLDNIESAEAIMEIATKIMEDKNIQKFVITNDDDIFYNLDTFSDSYIENLAYNIITKEFLGHE